MNNDPVASVRVVPWPVITSLLCLIGAVCWIHPFFDLKINPAFNSDSAMVLTAITEHVPLSENVFVWGGTHTGPALGALGWIYFRIFGALHLTDFLGVTNAVLFVIGCSAFVQLQFRGRGSLILLPAGLLLVLANFNTPLTSVSFAFTVTDIAHRPEVVPLLVLLSWLFLLLGEEKPFSGARWWIRSGLALFLAVVATWVSDLALIAGLIFVCLGVCRAWLLKLRYPWETAVIWLCSVATLKLLQKISVYGGGAELLYQLPDREDVRLLLGTALLNVWSSLTPATWVVVMLIGIFLGIALITSRRASHPLVRERALWQAVSLLAMGIIALLVPLGSKWVFLSGVHPRYFAPGALLVCIGAAQGGVCLFQHLMRPQWRPLAGATIIALLGVPLALTGDETAKVRRDMLAAGKSACYRAGEILIASDVRAIVGSFWDSYTYVLARPGFLKAAPTETVSRISVSNTFRVLGMSRLAWIERDPGKLQSVMNLRGVEFTESDSQLPARLPTGAYFKRYTPNGIIRLEFGRPECRIYLREGWSGDETDATHSWVWAMGRRAAIEIPLRADSAYQLEIIASAVPRPEGGQELTVTSGGQSLAPLLFGTDGRLARKVLLPPVKEGTGLQRIEFRFAYAMSPGKEQASGESRNLAVAFERATFVLQR
jgi:hypothetical protein